MDWSNVAEHIRRRQLGLDLSLRAEGLPSTAGLTSNNGLSPHEAALGSPFLPQLSNPVATSGMTGYASYMQQQYMIEEQLRRDLAAKDYLIRRARLLGTLNSINSDLLAAPAAFANTRIEPDRPGITRFLSDKRVLEPARKKAKRVASAPTFTSRDGVAHSFPLPRREGEVARSARISNLSSFRSLWDRLHSPESKIMSSLAGEIFARQVGRWDDGRKKTILQASERGSPVDAGSSESKPGGKRKRHSNASVAK
jgi:hypothetical protein